MNDNEESRRIIYLERNIQRFKEARLARVNGPLEGKLKDGTVDAVNSLIGISKNIYPKKLPLEYTQEAKRLLKRNSTLFSGSIPNKKEKIKIRRPSFNFNKAEIDYYTRCEKLLSEAYNFLYFNKKER